VPRDAVRNYDFHHKHIVVFSGNTGSKVVSMVVANNYGHGDFGSGTAVFDVQNSVATADSVTFFNNYVDLSATTNSTGGDGAIYAENDDASGSVSFHVYNNTVVGANTMAGIAVAESGITTDARNNIVQNWGTPFWDFDAAPLPSTMNYNDWYQPTVGGNGIWDDDGTGYSTLASWQTASGLDTNSIVSNPLLTSGGTPPSSSPVVTKGENLTSLCSTLPALCTDKAGTARPTSGGWDIGAFQH
jgi:hypothetical protein